MLLHKGIQPTSLNTSLTTGQTGFQSNTFLRPPPLWISRGNIIPIHGSQGTHIENKCTIWAGEYPKQVQTYHQGFN